MKKITLLLAVSFTGVMFAAPPESQTQPPPPRKIHRKMQDRKNQRNIWRAFAALSDAERKEMLTLQRNDPEKFREIMQKKAAEIMKAEQLEREKLSNFAKQYQSAKSEKERAALRTWTKEILKKHFNQRLAANRRHLEAMKRRAAMLEKELDKKEANADKIITLQAEAILSGKFPPPPPHHGPGLRPGKPMPHK